MPQIFLLFEQLGSFVLLLLLVVVIVFWSERVVAAILGSFFFAFILMKNKTTKHKSSTFICSDERLKSQTQKDIDSSDRSTSGFNSQRWLHRNTLKNNSFCYKKSNEKKIYWKALGPNWVSQILFKNFGA